MAGLVIGGNFSPGATINKNGTLLTITLPRDASMASGFIARGAFPNHQSGALVELSGRELRVRVEQDTSFKTGDTFNFFVPLRWA